ncbi:MAG: hypothetical protein O8C58_05650 [Candidatus Methanoperedens sp.]|nr:hypothetical protein [Candidatus Methanoperedens sp.]
MVQKLKAISGMKGVSITLKKGDRVITTGKGKTKIWGDVVGKVTKRRGNKVFVQWEGTSFPIEDERNAEEVRFYCSQLLSFHTYAMSIPHSFRQSERALAAGADNSLSLIAEPSRYLLYWHGR